MKSYFAYIRVSTTRQGEEGVSLQEQRAAIYEYAVKRGMTVTDWFEEQVSAAKRGRPVFNKIVGLLKSRKASGIIIHKIDRGARNLRDWADMAELMDRGIEVHFAHESIDLHTRSGRLSADILAVVAADYIRNLREETIKGINGRLKQGLYPFAAPLGYVNNGGGKVKTIDPILGPLIRQAFELYATRQYSLVSLSEELFKRGLRTRSGTKVALSQISVILHNSFYMGIIRFQNRKDTYAGVHQPLITSSLYNQVQFLLDGKRPRLIQSNNFLFRLTVKCEHCKLYLVGERKKGHVYYRCHRKTCPVTCIREERFEEAVMDVLNKLTIAPEEELAIKEALSEFKRNDAEISGKLRRDLEAKLDYIRHSIHTLLQKFLDHTITKETFNDGHAALLMKQKAAEEQLDSIATENSVSKSVERFVSDLHLLPEQFLSRRPDVVRSLLTKIFANITTSAKTILVTPQLLIQLMLNRHRTREGWSALLPLIARELYGDNGSSRKNGALFYSFSNQFSELCLNKAI